MRIRIASRTSQLAMVQTKEVAAELCKKIPDLSIEVVPIVTMGDKIQNCSLAQIGGKGLFIKSLEMALLEDRADIAMHSLKDVPPHLDSAFCIPAVLARESPYDSFVSNHYFSIHALASGAIVGTSSVRRKAALLHMRRDLDIRMIRGNVNTRLKKLDEGKYDALILAEAGLIRLKLEERIREVLPLELFMPSVGQGVIALECLSTRVDMIDMLQQINDPETFARMSAERAMNHALQANCTSPVGSFAEVIRGRLHLTGVVWSEDGQSKLETHQSGLLSEAEHIGQWAAEDLHCQGALELLNIPPFY